MSAIKQIIYNKKAAFEYEIIEKIEAGIMLVGTEVKSLREGKCSIGEGYVINQGTQMFLKNVNIPHYKHGNINNHEPLRIRKLLLHKKEIHHLIRAIKDKGTTVIPIKLYFKDSLVKVEIALCRGKKLHDKRENIKERDTKRMLSREMKNFNS